jgi:hypothetical protein
MPVCRWLSLTLDYIGAAIVFISIAASLLVAKHSSGINKFVLPLKNLNKLIILLICRHFNNIPREHFLYFTLCLVYARAIYSTEKA